MPDTVVRTPKGVLIRVDHDEAADLLDSLPISVSEESQRLALSNNIRTIGRMISEAPGVNLVIRSGTGEPMGDEVPQELRDLSLKRVKRASKDGLRVSQLISGVNQGESILTSDWFCDGFEPTGPTSLARGWRSVKDPILVILYVLDVHPTKPLKGKGPWICIAASLPHGGPGGSMVSNKNRGVE